MAKPLKDERRRPAARKLSEQLQDVISHANNKPITVREILLVLKGRGYTTLLIFLALIAMVPLPVFPALAGIPIMVIGLRLTLGQRPWLPKKMLDKSISPAVLLNVHQKSEKILHRLEKLLKPRGRFLSRYIIFRHLNGFIILLNGLLLLLPPPIMINFIPAITILLICFGMLEDDGVFIITSYLLTCMGLSYIVFLVLFGGLSWKAIIHSLGKPKLEEDAIPSS